MYFHFHLQLKNRQLQDNIENYKALTSFFFLAYLIFTICFGKNISMITWFGYVDQCVEINTTLWKWNLIFTGYNSFLFICNKIWFFSADFTSMSQDMLFHRATFVIVAWLFIKFMILTTREKLMWNILFKKRKMLY